ncbi:MAG: heparan-alpha-glucosaminide N-acetyltransferase domain-containing protein, partial [archaeon]
MNLEKRFWEIDSLRGIAILLMVFFHIISDLYHFAGLQVEIFSGFWWVLANS